MPGKSFGTPASEEQRMAVGDFFHLGSYCLLHPLVSVAQTRNSSSTRRIQYALTIVKGHVVSMCRCDIMWLLPDITMENSTLCCGAAICTGVVHHISVIDDSLRRHGQKQ